jgi:excisionase family DNA binding protein
MQLLTVKETADMLRVSPGTIRRHIASGKLPAVRIGRAIRIERDAVSQIVEPVGVDPDLERLAKAKPLTWDDPLWNIVGIATSEEGEPTDVSVNHDKYLAEAYSEPHE